ncbi:unnamed protein product [Sphenostylis stenocarpa]|uniref:Uncharacterized protein n=1 Tax=Sphenostylis stenocarpa TaxID=92480 RepID=A0AA86SWX1_9FABA|nr:unnamed protein product [Sphenostylis stenocarpa]
MTFQMTPTKQKIHKSIDGKVPLMQLATKDACKSVSEIDEMTKPHKFRSEPETLQLVSCLVPSNHDALHRLNHAPLKQKKKEGGRFHLWAHDKDGRSTATAPSKCDGSHTFK